MGILLFYFCSVSSEKLVVTLYLVHNGRLHVNEDKDIEW